MGLFQKAYDFFKNIKTPVWLRDLLQNLQDIMFAIAKEVGEQYITMVKTRILEAEQHTDWSSKEKFEYVLKESKKGFIDFSITLKDRELNLLIEFLFSQLKKIGAIK